METNTIAAAITAIRTSRTRTPKAIATSSPIASTASGRASHARTSTVTARTRMNGTMRTIVTPENDPALHNCARCAASRGALTISSELIARRAAEKPIPTKTTRMPVTRTPPAQARMSTPDTRPPTSAPTPVVAGLDPHTMIARRAPVAEPVDRPTMSGLPSGLPETVWKMAPDRPSAHPTPSAAHIRGRRTDCTKYTPKKSSRGPLSPISRRKDSAALRP